MSHDLFYRLTSSIKEDQARLKAVEDSKDISEKEKEREIREISHRIDHDSTILAMLNKPGAGSKIRPLS